ncbi:hypothetical protein F3Y22_tig00111441pilonHSYRG00044 [Hibiscus syriacus]|uniref:Di19 C-terminal domain-containing protein n=1 Tax=Hibiscus syriacus TaxID=106335 RepID=A0A6A2Y378_HIBSY|nr:hypothetical protein F3Y22_tig00111441pilonHSYRG00044 [Hibiscus syriacus]
MVFNHDLVDMLMGFEEMDGEDDIREEFPCPLFRVCPVCAVRVGDMVAHITLQHGKYSSGVVVALLAFLYNSLPFLGLDSFIFNFLNEWLHAANGSHVGVDLIHAFTSEERVARRKPAVPLGGSSCTPQFYSEPSTAKTSSDVNKTERLRYSNETDDDLNVQSTPLSVKDQEEKAKRCEFVQGLLLSTFLDDVL